MTSNSDGCWTKMLSNLKGLTSISSFACDSLADSLTKDLKKWRARTNADFPELFGPKSPPPAIPQEQPCSRSARRTEDHAWKLHQLQGRSFAVRRMSGNWQH